MRLDVDFDAKPRRFRNQQTRRSDAPFAEVKIVANCDAADAEPLDQVTVNKVLRASVVPEVGQG